MVLGRANGAPGRDRGGEKAHPRGLDGAGSDWELLSELRSGSEDAFSALVAAMNGRLLQLAGTFVSSRAAAEEVVQETWLGVLQGLAAFEGRASLKSWIFRILTNRARTKGAREARTVPFSSVEGPGQPEGLHDGAGRWITPAAHWQETPEALAHTREALRVLDAALASLPEGQRAVVLLRDVEGLDAEEVAGILDITDANQRVLLHRARSTLRRALGGRLGGDGVPTP